MHDDDPGVQNSELLYRRIADAGDTNMLVVDENTRDVQINSSVFALDDDGCSVYLHSVLARRDLEPRHVTVAPRNVVVSVSATTVRTHRLGVRPDPWPDVRDEGDAEHPRHEAHALIVNPRQLGSKQLLKARRAIARTAVICVKPD